MKAALRAVFRARRAAATAGEREAAEAAAIVWLKEFLTTHEEVGVVATYFSVGDEFPTGRIIDECRALGRGVALPRWDRASSRYRWALCEKDAPMRLGPMRIPEPDADAPAVDAAEIGLYLVPGLAFDGEGGRLGYGGGHFDRLLAEAREGAVIRGLCLPCQRSATPLPREKHDIPAPPIP